MNLSQLPYIISIARTGSLLAASRELEVSQSALSHYLSNLEQELGIDLFFRTKKKMYLTQAGQKYLRTARQILELVDGTAKAIQQLDRPAEQELRVGISPHSGARILAQNYVTFNHNFPSVRLVPQEGYADDLKAMLRKGEIDLCFTSGDAEEGLDWYPISRSELVLTVPAALSGIFPDQGDILEDLSPFYNSVFILPQSPSALYDNVTALLKETNFQPRVSFTTPNVVMLRQMILSGVGIGFLPIYQATDPALRYFRLHPSRYMTNCAYAQTGHTFTEAERYLMFLWLQIDITGPQGILWNGFNQALVTRYAPELVLDFEREGLI